MSSSRPLPQPVATTSVTGSSLLQEWLQSAREQAALLNGRPRELRQAVIRANATMIEVL